MTYVDGSVSEQVSERAIFFKNLMNISFESVALLAVNATLLRLYRFGMFYFLFVVNIPVFVH
jgi:hypothetical protein